MSISNQASGIRPGVCTSTTRPTAPYTGQVIMETDTGKMLYWTGSVWQAPWNTAWGVVALVSETTIQTNFASEATLLTTSSFTAVANRRYKVTYSEPSISLVSGTVNGLASIIRLTNISGSALYIQDVTAANIASTNVAVLSSFVTTFAAGSVILNASAGTSGGGTAKAARTSTRFAYLMVEDIGPT